MLDPLGALVITFAVMSFISVVGLILLHLIKVEMIRKIIFYLLTVWGMVISYCSVLATPSYMAGSVIISWGIGALSVIALLLQLCVKKDKAFLTARILVTVSVVAGMIDCFMI